MCPADLSKDLPDTAVSTGPTESLSNRRNGHLIHLGTADLARHGDRWPDGAAHRRDRLPGTEEELSRTVRGEGATAQGGIDQILEGPVLWFVAMYDMSPGTELLNARIDRSR